MLTGRSRPLLIAALLLIFSLLALISILPVLGYRPSTRYLAAGELFAAEHIRQLQETDAFASAILIENGFAYVVGGKAPLQDESQARGLTIWSVSDPEIPSLVGFLDGFFGYDVALKDGFAYIASGDELVVVDVRDVVRPLVVSVVPASGLFELHQVGRELYLLTATEVALLSLADPGNPQLVQTIPDLLALDVAAMGVMRFFLTESELVYYEPGAEGALVESGTIIWQAAPENSELISVDNELEMVGSLLFATGLGGWHLLDFAEPEAPDYVGFYTDEVARPAGISLDYPFLYVADWENGVVVFDVSEGERPVLVGYDRDLVATNVVFAGDVLFSSSRGLEPVRVLRFLGR